MTNVTRPTSFGKSCVCGQVHQKLRDLGWSSELPKVENHIFLIGREYNGPFGEVLRNTASNVPKPTAWDVRRTWSSVREQLPSVFRNDISAASWDDKLEECRCDSKPHFGRVNTASAYKLRKAFEGLVCGETDKNNGELWLCCPCLYHKALEKTYDTKGADYEVIYPKKLTTYRRRKFRTTLLQEMCGTEKPHKRQQGSVVDLLKAWKIYYKDKGWDKIARFQSSGKLGIPYVLFKSKNIVDPEVRKEKWDKTRPIAPTFHHPMREILSLVGRALYFMASRMEGEHFVLNTTTEVPKLLKTAMQQFAGIGNSMCKL